MLGAVVSCSVRWCGVWYGKQL